MHQTPAVVMQTNSRQLIYKLESVQYEALYAELHASFFRSKGELNFRSAHLAVE